MATNFFQRWSSRKLKAREEKAKENHEVEELVSSETTPAVTSESQEIAGGLKTDIEATQSESTTEAVNEPVAERTDSPLEPAAGEDEEQKPSIDDVAKVSFDSGVASFMKEGVEKSVKKAALRKLFHSDEFNYVSDMDDHTEDFSNVPTLTNDVTNQLRYWVNEVAEKADELLDADSGIEGPGIEDPEKAVAQIDSGVELPDELAHYQADSAAPERDEALATEDCRNIDDVTDEQLAQVDQSETINSVPIKDSIPTSKKLS
ncbi:DUF3306 domain-containing protein [Photobacterium sanctipauli]|uniref:DUF3306 domain-containing protein n=1 Tax=Photobacterium sanctipauli TaxID=1342794 RepID=UPI00068CD73E|nr:DUF3306 domain-containing protein [Photobacterium sanctipauli]